MSPDPIDSDESNDFHSGSATGSSYPVVPQRCTWACLKMEDGSWWTPQLWLFDTLWMGKHDENPMDFLGYMIFSHVDTSASICMEWSGPSLVDVPNMIWVNSVNSYISGCFPLDSQPFVHHLNFPNKAVQPPSPHFYRSLERGRV